MFQTRSRTTELLSPLPSLCLCIILISTTVGINLSSSSIVLANDDALRTTRKGLWMQPLVRESRSIITQQSRRVEYSKPSERFRDQKNRKRWSKKYENLSRRHRRSAPRDSSLIGRWNTRRKNFLHPHGRKTWHHNKYNSNNNNTNKQLILSEPHEVHKPSSKNHTVLTRREHLESVLNIPGVKCGRVPIYEKLYHRSINESAEVNSERGDFRILHGLDSVAGEWPWIVRILECIDNETCSTCTGTLLNDKWIITAGHCAYNRSRPEKFTATFGLSDLVSPENSSYTLPVEKLIVHPDYKNLNNDLTLVKLAEPVTFSDNVMPACLVHATRNVVEFAKGKRCYTVGYGLTEGMEEAIKLQKLEISAKQPSECNSYTLGASELRPGAVCIGPPPGKIGSSCKGDSGGPNLCYDPKDGSWAVFSTVSYGPPNCDRENGDKWLTVSADLSNYRTWILSTIQTHS